jgi:hypothetical protein
MPVHTDALQPLVRGEDVPEGEQDDLADRAAVDVSNLAG